MIKADAAAIAEREATRKAEKAALDEKQLAATAGVDAENDTTPAANTTECGAEDLPIPEKCAEETGTIGKAIEVRDADA